MTEKNLKIAIVDDDRTITMLIKMMLSKEGYNNLFIFNSSVEAVNSMDKIKPDLICSDINMPEFTGLDLLKKFKPKYPDTIMVMISGSTEFNDVLTALNYGAYDYITKPIKKENLMNVINKTAEVISLRKKNKEYLEELTNKNELLTNFQTNINNELRLAQELQRKITPQILESFGNFDIFFFRKYSLQIGGDFIDGYKYKNSDKFAIILGDMPGHGIPAALILSAFKAFTFQAVSSEPECGIMMDNINQNIINLNLNVYPSSCCFILDSSNNSIEYTNAGHPYPFIIDSAGEIKILENENQMLLGFSDNIRYNASKIKLNPGQTIFLYSDGFIEVTPAQKEMEPFDINSLTAYYKEIILNKIPFGKATENLHSKLMQYHGSENFDDDMMLLAITLKK